LFKSWFPPIKEAATITSIDRPEMSIPNPIFAGVVGSFFQRIVKRKLTLEVHFSQGVIFLSGGWVVCERGQKVFA
jgi:hypothetical protein